MDGFDTVAIGFIAPAFSTECYRAGSRWCNAELDHIDFRVLPGGRRSFLVTTMFCGFMLDSALGGVASAHIVADFGWRTVLIIGGLMPLMLLPVLWMTLRESVRYWS